MSIELTQDLVHVDEAVALLIEQYKNSPNLKDLITAFINRVQDAENMFYDLWQSRFLDNAIGSQLDGLGAIVGVSRENTTDDRYRVRIRARILLNQSSGTADQIIELIQLLLSESYTGTLTYLEMPPAGFFIDSTSGVITSDEATETGSAILSARAAGVMAQFIYTLTTSTFRFSASGITETGATTKGFSDLSQITGGYLAGVVSNA